MGQTLFQCVSGLDAGKGWGRHKQEELITTNRKMLSPQPIPRDHTRERSQDHRSMGLHWIVSTVLWTSVLWRGLAVPRHITVGSQSVHWHQCPHHMYTEKWRVQSAHSAEVHRQPPARHKSSLLPQGMLCAMRSCGGTGEHKPQRGTACPASG